MFDTLNINDSNGIRTISLNRPESLNAFNAGLRSELLTVLQSSAQDSKVRVLVLRGNGRAFCAGADLTEVHPSGQTVDQRINNEYKPLLLTITECPTPVIASVNGAAAGIGCALAMACDLVIMSESAYYYQAFSALSIIPDGGVSWHLPRQVGSKRAYELMVTGERLYADECLRLGLINKIAADEALVQETTEFAQQLLTRAPLSLRHSKETIKRAAQLNLADTISMEAEIQKYLYTTEDHAEGKAAFLEKRKPEWKGK